MPQPNFKLVMYVGYDNGVGLSNTILKYAFNNQELSGKQAIFPF